MENAPEEALSEMVNSFVEDMQVIPENEDAELLENFEENSTEQNNIQVDPDYPEVVLTKDMIRTGLSHVTRTLDTFEFAYSRYDGRNKNITNIDVLEDYTHLRVVELSGNHLWNFKALAPMKHLLVLVLNDNELKSFEDVPELPFLQALSARGNHLTDINGLFKNSLAYLQLNFNEINNVENFNAEIFPWLTVLELRGNKLQSLKGLNIPTLVRLFVAANELTSLEDLKNCVNLTHLHARDNLISKLDNFPCLEKLEYVNLRHNNLKRFTQSQFLGNSPNIRTLMVMENPIASLAIYKIEMIATNLNLKRLDKEPITEIDLVQGRQLRTGRDNGVAPGPEDDAELVTPPPEEIEDEEEEAEGEEGDEEQQSYEAPRASEIKTIINNNNANPEEELKKTSV